MKRCIFIDLDGTLIKLPSVEVRCLKYLLKNKLIPYRNFLYYVQFYLKYYRYMGRKIFRLNKAYLTNLDEIEIKEKIVEFITEELFVSFNQKVLAEIESQRRPDCLMVLLTAAPQFLAEPIFKFLKLDYMIATELVSKQGKFQCAMPTQYPYGYTKLLLAELYCQQNGLELKDCIAYADSFSDLPLLYAVGEVNTVNPDKKLHQISLTEKWNIITES